MLLIRGGVLTLASKELVWPKITLGITLRVIMTPLSALCHVVGGC
jgi:hypothetical protein